MLLQDDDEEEEKEEEEEDSDDAVWFTLSLNLQLAATHFLVCVSVLMYYTLKSMRTCSTVQKQK